MAMMATIRSVDPRLTGHRERFTGLQSLFEGSSTRFPAALTGLAGHGSVRDQTGRTRLFPSRGEVAPCAEVHFVRRLTMESRMREARVVLLDVERDESSE